MANGLLGLIASGGNAAPVSSYYRGVAERQAADLAQQKAQSEAMYKQMQQQNMLSQMLKRQADTRTAQMQANARNEWASNYPEGNPLRSMVLAGQNPTDMQRFMFGSPEQQQRLLQYKTASTPSTTVNVSPGAKKFAEEQAKSIVTQAQEMAEQSKVSGQQVEIYDQLLRLAEDMDEETFQGNRGSLVNQGNRLAASLGLGSDMFGDTTTSQQFESLTNQLVQDELRKNAGIQTEGDAKRTAALIGNIDSDPKALRELHSWRRSRAMLDGELAMRGVSIGYGSDDPAKIRQEWVGLLRAKSKTPAVMEVPGGYMYFADYLRAYLEEGGTRQEALDEWLARAK